MMMLCNQEEFHDPHVTQVPRLLVKGLLAPFSGIKEIAVSTRRKMPQLKPFFPYSSFYIS